MHAERRDVVGVVQGRTLHRRASEQHRFQLRFRLRRRPRLGPGARPAARGVKRAIGPAGNQQQPPLAHIELRSEAVHLTLHPDRAASMDELDQRRQRF